MKTLALIIAFSVTFISGKGQTKCISIDSLYTLHYRYDRLAGNYCMLGRIAEKNNELWATTRGFIIKTRYYDSLSNQVYKLITSLLPPEPPFKWPSKQEVEYRIDSLKKLIPPNNIYKGNTLK